MHSKPKAGLILRSRKSPTWIVGLVSILATKYTVYHIQDPTPEDIPIGLKIHLFLDRLLFSGFEKKRFISLIEAPFSTAESFDLLIFFDEKSILRFKNFKKAWLVPDNSTIGYWEVIQQLGVVSIVVQEVKPDGEKHAIATSTKRTDLYSISRNRKNYRIRLLILLARMVNEKFTYCNTDCPIPPANLRTNKPNGIFIHMHYIIKRTFHREATWGLFILRATKALPVTLDDAIPFEKPDKTLWADPFPIEYENQNFIFIEEQQPHEPKAHISVLELSTNNKIISCTPVLTKPYHLSYPFVFQHEKEWYMIPETKEAKSVQIFKAKNFPYDWEYEITLIDNIWAVDATPYFDGKLWWLFANVCDQDGESAINDELCLYYSENLLSDQWTPHQMNPIVSDATMARPAGRIFEYNGKKYRPSQNSMHQYGKGINLMEIEVLNPANYKENLIRQFIPNNTNLKRYHTFQYMGDKIIIDGISA